MVDFAGSVARQTISFLPSRSCTRLPCASNPSTAAPARNSTGAARTAPAIWTSAGGTSAASAIEPETTIRHKIVDFIAWKPRYHPRCDRAPVEGQARQEVRRDVGNADLLRLSAARECYGNRVEKSQIREATAMPPTLLDIHKIRPAFA